MISRIPIQNKIYNDNNNQPGNAQYIPNQHHLSQKNSNNYIKNYITPNLNLNKKIINPNQGINPANNNQNIMNSSDELGKAFAIIRRECKKRDDKIKILEKKVNELTNKLNILMKNKMNMNSNNNNNYTNEQYIKPLYLGQKENNFVSNDNREGEIINRVRKDFQSYGLGYNMNNINNQRNNSYIKSYKDNFVDYNSDTEQKPTRRFPGYDNLSNSNEQSALTYNGGSHASTKDEVKSYLKEVKSKIEPAKFKKFIRNIKLLTDKKNSALNKDIIVESVRKLFGDNYKELFIKFQCIIGVRK